MGSSENLQAAEFIDNLMPIAAHRVVHMHGKIDCRFLAPNMLLLIPQWRNSVLNEILLVAFLLFNEGIQTNSLSRCEKHCNHNVLIEIPDLSFGITSSRSPASIEWDSIT
jgi:hypothetical protein